MLFLGVWNIPFHVESSEPLQLLEFLILSTNFDLLEVKESMDFNARAELTQNQTADFPINNWASSNTYR